jgi:hypothetical protein
MGEQQQHDGRPATRSGWTDQQPASSARRRPPRTPLVWLPARRPAQDSALLTAVSEPWMEALTNQGRHSAFDLPVGVAKARLHYGLGERERQRRTLCSTVGRSRARELAEPVY